MCHSLSIYMRGALHFSGGPGQGRSGLRGPGEACGLHGRHGRHGQLGRGLDGVRNEGESVDKVCSDDNRGIAEGQRYGMDGVRNEGF